MSTDQDPAGGPEPRDTAGAPEEARRAGAGAESRSEAAARRSLARLYEDEQRVDGRFRWSVGGATTRCCRCGATIEAGTSFTTALVAADADTVPALAAGTDPLEVFERRDHCTGCFAELPDEQVFAYWKSTLPAREEPRRKTVNLASLRAYFDRLLDPEAGEHGFDDGGDFVDHREDTASGPAGTAPDEEDRSDAAGDDADETAASAAGSVPGESGEAAGEAAAAEEASQRESADLERQVLVYLLGLFLVRRRILRWERSDDHELTLICRQSGNRYTLPIPPVARDELARRVDAFEQLLS